jgi:E3 ubiquitin-protein ligase RNF115/126
MTTIFFGPQSQGSFFGNLDLNFRSLFSNDSIMQHILRLSELDRGRSGTPPASEECIKNLPEVEITEKDCKQTNDKKEYPRCSICCEDLTEKATKLPCGHLFNQECIGEWLGQHNQCPVCRFDLPTNDSEYERRKAAAKGEAQNSTQQH